MGIDSNEKGRVTHPFNAVGSQPVERLDEKQEPEHEKEGDIEIISENSEREE